MNQKVYSKAFNRTLDRTIINISILSIAILCLILPNSFQVSTAISLIFGAALSVFYSRNLQYNRPYLLFIYLNIIITILYLLVGLINQAPDVALLQVIIIYIISPILWFLVLTLVLNYLGKEELINHFIWITWMCCISSFVFFYLFENFGPNAVVLFKENANVDTRDGYSAATLFVYGTLIFLAGAFFAAPDVIKNKFIMLTTLAIIALTAITSGRTALMLSVIIGIFGFLFLSSKASSSFKNRLTIIITFTFSLLLVVYIATSFRNIDTSYIIELSLNKISSGGGSERSEQSRLLLKSFFDNYALGAGHGIGIDYIRSDIFPWRYEAVWFATLHRVGLLGTLIYSLPFIYYLSYIFKKILAEGLSVNDRFFLGGFISAFAASNTNPYLEGMPFQWMYILPFLAFFFNNTNS